MSDPRKPLKPAPLAPINDDRLLFPRRSMVTSTPVSNRYSQQRIIQKPQLSPITSDYRENVDVTGDLSDDLFAEDSIPSDSPVPPKKSTTDEDDDEVVQDSMVDDSMAEDRVAEDSIVQDSVVDDSMATDSLVQDSMEYRSVHSRSTEGDESDEADHSRSFLEPASRPSNRGPPPSAATPRRQQTLRERLLRKSLQMPKESSSSNSRNIIPEQDSEDEDSDGDSDAPIVQRSQVQKPTRVVLESSADMTISVADSEDEDASGVVVRPVPESSSDDLDDSNQVLEVVPSQAGKPKRVVLDSSADMTIPLVDCEDDDEKGDAVRSKSESSDSDLDGTISVENEESDSSSVVPEPSNEDLDESIQVLDVVPPAEKPKRVALESSADMTISLVDSDYEDASGHSVRSTPESSNNGLDDSIQVLEVVPTQQSTRSRQEIQNELNQAENIRLKTDLNRLPDKGERVLSRIRKLRRELDSLPSEPPRIPEMFQERSSPSDGPGSSHGPKVIAPPKMSSLEMERLVSADKGKRLFGGKMTDNRINQVSKVTGDAIDRIYKQLNTIPEHTETETPKGVKIELMRHQKIGLSWMIWREQQVPPAGILADDMGLGKTLSLISLILHQKNARLEREAANDTESEEARRDAKKKAIAKDQRLVCSNATLVIAPASLINQWAKEIESRVKAGRLNVHVFYGPKPKREKNAKRLAQYDVVITTYNLVGTELISKDIIDDEDDGRRQRKFNESSVLGQIMWDRIILDEAHQIKNRTSNASRAACRLSAINRWCLTGTPIHNELWDLFSLVRFMRVSPFDEEKLWKEYIMMGNKNTQRLNTLIKSLLLRRTKAQTDAITNKPLVDLKPREFTEVEVVLEGLEQKVYQQMFIASQQQVKQLLKNQEDMERYGMIRRKPGESSAMVPVQNPFLFNNTKAKDNFQRMNCILVVLLKLRQACVHLALTKEHIDIDAFDTLGSESNDPTTELNREMANMSIVGDELTNNVLAAVSQDDNGQVEQMFELGYKSAKTRALLKELDKVLEKNDKCVIVSQWTSMLDIVECHLKKRSVRYTSITGKVPTKDRQERVESFNEPDGKGTQVMLLSLTAGGVGLNLIGGNHLFLLDLHWNPALENQACDRIYRMGQRKNVFIHKFICKDTIEQRVLELQNTKTELANGVLDGAMSKKMAKLNMNDLKFLFDLNRPAEPVPERTEPVRPIPLR
ncbi:hypothetical protein L596_019406 [Steinernema carpocapsae]|uniref:Helicase ATP-binding domain-containing protein n=1 Tax=Steinernema carpocapsae TaxID=34508 RepID=A0A4U5MRA8_STECR|nr:hypothetical protein L596_019406 [Steinernema carpocapsae]